MFKRNVLRSLVLVLALGLIFGFCVPFCFAEELTITTYYPSPYGVYNELQTNKFAVGDTDDSGGLNPGDLPPANGQLYTARSVIFKPRSSDPGSDRVTGELIYNSSAGTFKYWNGSKWVPLGGGGCYVSYSGSCLTGFTSKGDGGWWSPAATSASKYYVFHPNYSGCMGWCSSEVSDALVCCR